MTRRRRTAVDRTVLGLGGLVLALAGSWLAATDRTVTDRLPSWWPPASAGSVLLDRDRLAHLPAVCAVAAEAERAAAPYTAHTRVRLSAAAPHRSAHVR
ncbi:hypothetical protein ACFY4I_21590 [Streptomyces scabiei]|uniref:hypothetical protein n=1 Tax=Streptomyces scabiei TaxID=1930 RepID=UPI0036BD0DD8